MQPLGTKKNHGTSWDKKVTQPLKTKIKKPLGTKKITQSIGTKKGPIA